MLMADIAGTRDWSKVLDQLDRHGARGQLSPDLATLADLMDLYRIPGISIAMGRQDGQIWTASYGTVGTDVATPIGSRTVFQACSISKHVAAFGALRLVADGVLELDADIHAYLTSWQLPASDGRRANVTLRQLLAHTAGLSYNWFRGYGTGEAIPSLLQTLAGQAPANTPPVRASLLPGSRFRYSGSHFAVLQQLLVDVTGSRFEELMHALVLEPVRMADSSFDQQFPRTRPELVALGHHGAGTPVAGGWRMIPEMAGAGLWTTPTDLVRFELEITRAAAGKSQLLDQDLAEQMLTPQTPGSGYGLGTEVNDDAGYRRFGHTGGNVGYNCFSHAWPDAGAAVAVMTNSEDAREVLGSINAAAERQYATYPQQALAGDDVTGRYLLRDNYPIDITAADSRLTLTAPNQPPAVLQQLPNGRYRIPGLDLEIRFQRTDDQTHTMQLRQENLTQTATRHPQPRLARS
jgi:CubicO group peptidase (beta-lactamase class C family)